jgi:uncharacterized membrane protein
VFFIAKRYVSQFYVLLCALVFVYQVDFLYAGVTSVRSRMGLLFFAFVILSLFDDEIVGEKRRVLFFAFLSCMIVSYYAFSYLFVFLIFIVLIRSAIPRAPRLNCFFSSNSQKERIFLLSTLLICAAFVVLWWGVLTQRSRQLHLSFLPRVEQYVGRKSRRGSHGN